jgi:sulfur-oxidizing protein SoxX
MKLLNKFLIATAISGLIAVTGSANGDLVKKGEKIFNTKKLGNCLACHDVSGKKMDGPGSFGPKLVGLKYWDDKDLYDIVYDIYKARNLKVSPMPAFGTNGWLSDAEIKAVVAYLKTIE